MITGRMTDIPCIHFNCWDADLRVPTPAQQLAWDNYQQALTDYRTIRQAPPPA